MPMMAHCTVVVTPTSSPMRTSPVPVDEMPPVNVVFFFVCR